MSDDLRKLAPIHILAMIQVACGPTTYTESSIPGGVDLQKQVVTVSLVRDLEVMGLVGTSHPDRRVSATEMGLKWLEMLEDTPMPVQRWIDPRKEKRP